MSVQYSSILSAAHIAQNSVRALKMLDCLLLHELTYHADRIAKVGSGDSEIILGFWQFVGIVSHRRSHLSQDVASGFSREEWRRIDNPSFGTCRTYSKHSATGWVICRRGSGSLQSRGSSEGPRGPSSRLHLKARTLLLQGRDRWRLGHLRTTKMHTGPFEPFQMNKEQSDLETTNPILRNHCVIFEFQARGLSWGHKETSSSNTLPTFSTLIENRSVGP